MTAAATQQQKLSLDGDCLGKEVKKIIECDVLECEIKAAAARTFDAIQLRKKLLAAIHILKRKSEGFSTNDISGTFWSRSWVREVNPDYIKEEIERFKTLPQPKPRLKPISVSFMDYFKHKAHWKFEEDEIVAVLEGLDQGLSTRKLAILVGSNTEAITKLVEVLDKKGIDLSSLNEVGGDMNVRNKWDSINSRSSRGLRSDKVAVEGCVRPIRY